MPIAFSAEEYHVEILIIEGEQKANQPSTEALTSADRKDSPAQINESTHLSRHDAEKLKKLINDHLTLIAKLDSNRLTMNEWRRLLSQSSLEIKQLLATEGYFSPTISPQESHQDDRHLVIFNIHPNRQAIVQEVSLNFIGEINHLDKRATPNADHLKKSWQLQPNTPFTQKNWSDAKQNVVTRLLSQRFPQAKIAESQALVDPVSNQVSIKLTVDSGPSVYFGELKIEGLVQYPESLLRNLNTIKAGDLYSQTEILSYQATLQDTGKFSSVEVRADTTTLDAQGRTDLLVNVIERTAKTVSFGVGVSTNTGARVQVNYTDRNLFERGLLWETSVKVEQRAQSAISSIKFPTDANGYRDSINNSLIRLDVEGQVTTAINNGVKRTWGDSRLEQFVGVNLLHEYLDIDGESSEFNKSATVAYGLTLRRLNNDISPTQGFIFNTQFQFAPLEEFSDGRFLQSQAKIQTYYRLAKNTQFIGRLEAGMVTGSQSVPATYLFRAGGDQSVRGYNFQSLGIDNGDAVLGGRVLLTGSTELVQWLTPAWGAALFVDFGNAAQRWSDYEPAYGYGIGARWKSPVGPVGVDVAYGEKVDEYHLHFNLGVSF